MEGHTRRAFIASDWRNAWHRHRASWVILCQEAISQFAMAKSRGWCFTINNPTVLDELEVESLKDCETVAYLVYGKETGEEGTPHFQGFLRFKHPVTLQRVKQFLQRAHLEVQRGTAKQAAEYCKKDGDYIEYGELPTSGAETTKAKWRRVIELAEEGQLETIKDEYPSVYLLHRPKLLSLRLGQPEILMELVNEWWWGPTGTGKSRKLWAEYPDHFPKSLNKWWDNYDGEAVIGIEEMTPAAGQFLAHYLKIWADRYPFCPEVKGATMKKIRPKKIIVLSNYKIEECFPDVQDHLPLKRRFKVVHFDTL